MNLSSLLIASSARKPCRSSTSDAEEGFCTLMLIFFTGAGAAPLRFSSLSGTRSLMPSLSISAWVLLSDKISPLILPYFTRSPTLKLCGSGVLSSGCCTARASSFARFMARCFSRTSLRLTLRLASEIAR